MHFVIEFLWIRQLQLVFHIGIVSHAHEVVVPRALTGYHKEAQETIGQKHLYFFIMTGQITLRIVSFVGVLFAPLETTRSQLVRCERTGAGCETASDNDGLLTIPDGILRHNPGVRGYILRRELRQLVWLRMYPSQRLHLLQILMVG